MALPVNPAGFPTITLENFFSLVSGCLESAYSTATTWSQTPSHPFGNLLLDRGLIIVSTIPLAIFVVLVVGLMIVVPCGLLIWGVTLAFKYFIEKRLRTGDSWYLKESSGARQRGGRIVVYGNEKELPGILVEHYD